MCRGSGGGGRQRLSALIKQLNRVPTGTAWRAWITHACYRQPIPQLIALGGDPDHA